MNKSISELDAADTIGQDDILLVSQKTANGYTSKKILASNFKGAAGESGLPAIAAFKAEQTQINAKLQASINSVSGGYFKAFDTLDDLNAATGMTTGQVAKIMNDSDATANGDYYFDGSSWIKGYDALTDAKNYANANPMFKKVQLKAGDDLDYIVNSGIYYNSSDLTETQLKNMPEMYGSNTALGTLVVYSVYETSAVAIHQVFYPFTGTYHYHRITDTSGVFGAWEKSVTKADIDLLKNKTQVQMLSLEQAQTLDVLTMPAGKYSWADFPEGRALTNMPPVDYPYGLLEIKETANGISGSYRMAIFYPYGRHKEFWINKNFETGWTGWMRYDDTETIKKSLNLELIHLPNDTDVLTLDVGTYVVDDFSIGNTFANMPNTPYKLGRLEVKHTGGLGGVPFKTVIFYPYGHADNSFYINTSYEAGAWTGWRTYKSYEDIKAEINAAATNAVSYIPNLIMPPKFYALPGTELHIYPEHLVVDDCESYNHAVVANRGQHRNRGFVWTPTTADSVGDYGLTWTLFDKQSARKLATASTVINLVDKNKDSGKTKKVMVIGDSYINGGVITQQLLDLANNDVTKVQLVGSRGTGANLHEGRSGWKISDYATAGRTYVKFTVSGVTTAPTWNTTTYTYNGVTFTVLETAISNGSGTITAEYFGGSLTDGASGTLTKTNNSAGDATINFSNLQKLSGNPFWYNGQVDFGHHLTANSLATPDIVLIELGVNDCFGQTTDDGVVSLTATAFSQLDTLIASIKATNSNVKIGLCLSPKYSDQDAFGIDYGASYTSWRCTRNIAIWNRELIKRYENSESQNIFVVASGFSVDTLTSYPTIQEPINSHNATLIDVQSNSVHPYNKGYLQIGDAMFAFIKAV